MKLNEELVTAIARVCHAANREWSLAWGTSDVQPVWDEASEEIRQSCIQGVKHALENPHISPKLSHENWMQQRLAAGWKLGPKDLKAKTHPCLVQYHELNSKERLKDHVFTGIVAAFKGEIESEPS